MNLFITDSTGLYNCAKSLDNHRLKKQFSDLHYAISNIIRNKPLYRDLCETIVGSENFKKQVLEILAKPAYVNHPLTLWAGACPLHLYFLINYYACAFEELRFRKLALNGHDRSRKLLNKLSYKLITSLRLHNIEEDIWNLNLVFYNQHKDMADLITNTRNSLISSWKSDILLEQIYISALAKHKNKDKNSELIKPRKPRSLTWGMKYGSSSPIEAPKWAKKELEEYKKGL